MTDLTHVNFTDIDGVLRRADSGDESAKSAVQRNARDWLLQLLAGVATSWARVAELERENGRLQEELKIVRFNVDGANTVLNDARVFITEYHGETVVNLGLGPRISRLRQRLEGRLAASERARAALHEALQAIDAHAARIIEVRGDGVRVAAAETVRMCVRDIRARCAQETK